VPIEYDLHQPIYLLYLQHPIAQACHTSVVSSKGLNRAICGMKKGAVANPSGAARCFYVFVEKTSIDFFMRMRLKYR